MFELAKINSFFSNFVKLTTGIIIFSPLLLMSFLNIFDSTSFFPLLISETYIFSNLVISAIFISLFITMVYIIPYYAFVFLKNNINKNNSYEIEEVMILNKKQDKHSNISPLTFLIGISLTSFLLYILIKSETPDNNYLFFILFSLCTLIYYTLEIFNQNKEKYKWSLAYFSICFSIGLLITLINIIGFFYLGQYNAAITFIAIIISIYLLFSISKKIAPNLESKLLILLTSLFFIQYSLLICFIYFTKTTNSSSLLDDARNFIFYLFLIVVIPNAILLITNIKINTKTKTMLLITYLISLMLISNFYSLMNYEFFKFMKITSDEEVSVSIKKWRDNTSVKYHSKEEFHNVYIVYQTAQNTILCQKKIFEKRPSLLDIQINKIKDNKASNDTDKSKCYFAKTEDITFI